MNSSITHLVFAQKIWVPGSPETVQDFARCHGWQLTILDDGAVRVAHATRTSFAPFTVRGIGYSYRTDDDVSVKAAAKVTKAAKQEAA